jgi:hypothetical protein
MLGTSLGIAKGAIVPQPAFSPVDFFYSASGGYTDISFQTDAPSGPYYITENGVFATVQFRASASGTGTINFSFTDALQHNEADPDAPTSIGLQAGPALAYTVVAGTGTWTANASGNWLTPGNWANTFVPNGVDNKAIFGNVITAPRTVSVPSLTTVGAVSFNSSQAYTIAGAGLLKFDVSTGQAEITVISGQHAITSPITVSDSIKLSVSTGGALQLPAVDMPGLALTLEGGGKAIADRVRAGAATLSGGSTLELNSGQGNAGTSSFTSLTFSANSRLNLQDARLIVDYASGGLSPYASLLNQLTAGTIRVQDSGPGVIAILQANEYAGTTFGGVPIDSSSVLLLATLGGDATGDRSVNFEDLLRLAQNYGRATGATWAMGDGNYDGAVNFIDLLMLAQNYGRPFILASGDLIAGSGIDQFAGDWALAQSLVPEPGTLAIAACGLLRPGRSRRH